MRNDVFDYSYRAAGLTDIGQRRRSNQDEVILAPEIGFFGVSDGMGGLTNGAAAAAYVKKSMPLLLESGVKDWASQDLDPDRVSEKLAEAVRLCSDHLFMRGNTDRFYSFGATLAGVQLYRECAVFVCLGDSRGYVLRKYRKMPEQITEDMNIAGVLVRAGEMTKEEALDRPESSRLTAFVGMTAPASPAVYVTKIRPGDRILLCSDGLYSMVPEREIVRIMRSSRSPMRICQRLINKANENGGRDNISVAYVKIR